MSDNYLRLLIALSMACIVAGCSSLNSVHRNKSDGAGMANDQVEKVLSPTEVKQLSLRSDGVIEKELETLALSMPADEKAKQSYIQGELFLKASALQMEGDFKHANLLMRKILEISQGDDYLKKKLAVNLIREGELEESLKLLEEVYAQEKPLDERLGLVLAGVYSSIGQMKKAQHVYNKIIQESPGHEDACIFLSKTFYLQEKIKKAKRALKNCEDKSKGKGIFAYHLGKYEQEQGNKKLATTNFKRALAKEPGLSKAALALGEIKENKDQNGAVEFYKKYLSENSGDAAILSRLVQLLFNLERFGESIPYAERLIDLDPNNLNLKVKLGILYTDNKEYSKAIGTFNELLVQVPESDKLHYYLGAIYQEIGKYEMSIDHFLRIPVESGLYQDSSTQAAKMLSELALTQEGEARKLHTARLTDLVEKRGQDQDAQLTLDLAVVMAGHFELLEEPLNALRLLEPMVEHKNFTNGHTYYLASLYEKAGQFEKAYPLVREIIERDPDDAYAHNFLGYSYLEQGGDLDDAYHHIRRAIELKPDDGYIRDSLGWYYYKTGDHHKALVELEKAVKQVPDDVSIQKHLAVVYGKLGDFSRAKKYLVKAIELVTASSEKQELEKALEEIRLNRLPASFLDN